MASASSFLGGEYLKGEILKNSGPIRGSIAAVGVETFKARQAGESDKQQLVLTVDLGSEEKKLGLNKTNLRILISSYGDDTDRWIGRAVVIYFDPNVSFGGRVTGGLRVKVPTAKPSLAESQQQVNAEPTSTVDPDDDMPF